MAKQEQRRAAGQASAPRPPAAAAAPGRSDKSLRILQKSADFAGASGDSHAEISVAD